MVDPEILYCDNHLLVLNKPAGLLTQPNQTRADSLEAFGKRYLKQRFAKQGNVFLEAVHRLDRPVSGVVLFARTSKALSRLNRAQVEGRFQKRYLAIAEGHIIEGEFVDYLAHASKRAVPDPNGKRCCLKFRALKKGRDYTLLEIALKTGRYHQIRAQFALRGHPLLGDRKYGSSYPLDTLFLHHFTLQIPHPITDATLNLRAPLPAAWASYLDTPPSSNLDGCASCLSHLATGSEPNHND